MGIVVYQVINRSSEPYSFFANRYEDKDEGIKHLRQAKKLYPDTIWTLEAIYIIGHKVVKRKAIMTSNDL
jgi:hypothetical protein